MPPVDVTPKPEAPKMYLGDAVYAKFDGYHICLYTSDGIYVTNEIALEPQVLEALDTFRTKLGGQYAPPSSG